MVPDSFWPDLLCIPSGPSCCLSLGIPSKCHHSTSTKKVMNYFHLVLFQVWPPDHDPVVPGLAVPMGHLHHQSWGVVRQTVKYSKDFHGSPRLVLTRSRWERRSLWGRKPELFLKLFSSLRDNLSYLVKGVGRNIWVSLACLIHGIAKISDQNRPSWHWVSSPGLMGKLFHFSGHWHTALTLLWAPHDAFLDQQNKPCWMAFSDSCIWNTAHRMFQIYVFFIQWNLV